MYFGFDDISIAYGDEPLIRGLTVSFEKGSVTAIVGPNGCGKSSLLRTLTRAVKPVRGCARLEGRDVRAYGRRELAGRLAVLPQVHEAPPDLPVRTLVGYGRYPHVRPGQPFGKDDRAAVARALCDTGTEHLADRALGTLSGGERQRVWVAMALCREPEVLVLDEPTTYLDVGCQIEVLELLRRLNAEQGVTVVMVLHDLNLAARYADSLCAVYGGGVFGMGPPAEVLTADLLRRVFRVEARVQNDSVNGCPYFIPQAAL